MEAIPEEEEEDVAGTTEQFSFNPKALEFKPSSYSLSKKELEQIEEGESGVVDIDLFFRTEPDYRDPDSEEGSQPVSLKSSNEKLEKSEPESCSTNSNLGFEEITKRSCEFNPSAKPFYPKGKHVNEKPQSSGPSPYLWYKTTPPPPLPPFGHALPPNIHRQPVFPSPPILSSIPIHEMFPPMPEVTTHIIETIHRTPVLKKVPLHNICFLNGDNDIPSSFPVPTQTLNSLQSNQSHSNTSYSTTPHTQRMPLAISQVLRIPHQQHQRHVQASCYQPSYQVPQVRVPHNPHQTYPPAATQPSYNTWRNPSNMGNYDCGVTGPTPSSWIPRPPSAEQEEGVTVFIPNIPPSSNSVESNVPSLIPLIIPQSTGAVNPYPLF